MNSGYQLMNSACDDCKGYFICDVLKTIKKQAKAFLQQETFFLPNPLYNCCWY